MRNWTGQEVKSEDRNPCAVLVKGPMHCNRLKTTQASSNILFGAADVGIQGLCCGNGSRFNIGDGYYLCIHSAVCDRGLEGLDWGRSVAAPWSRTDCELTQSPQSRRSFRSQDEGSKRPKQRSLRAQREHSPTELSNAGVGLSVTVAAEVGPKQHGARPETREGEETVPSPASGLGLSLGWQLGESFGFPVSARTPSFSQPCGWTTLFSFFLPVVHHPQSQRALCL